ncbi:MAG: glycoside hydrolase family 27 protein [Alphaproteobacteria bacterium]|nr:glycoside hydrolase family 27 protein [Alphaproteobacteria bacterium]
MRQFTYAVTAALTMVLFLCAGAAHGQQASARGTPGLEPTPVLGWSSWSFLRKDPTATRIEAQARAMRDSGLQKIGYQYVNIDDFWYPCPGPQGPDVDPYGRWVTDPARFPPQGNTDGIEVVAAHVHGLGMKFGIYVTPGISKQAVSKKTRIEGTRYTADQIAVRAHAEENYNCKGMVSIDYSKPGAQEYINSWVNRFAKWGVDYIKLDGIEDYSGPDVEAWAKAIRQSGRPIILDATEGDFTRALAPTLMKYADQWEFAPDIECESCATPPAADYMLTTWTNIAKRFDLVAEWQPYAGSGRWNDYDSIEVGNGRHNGLNPDERQTQLSLWALASAPLILGVDLTHLDQQDLQYLKNTAVLAVDQDGIAAKRIVNVGDQQVFAKMETHGEAIVGLFNTAKDAQTIVVRASAVGLPQSERGYSTQDLWTGKRKNTERDISAVVPPHGVVLYRVTTL